MDDATEHAEATAVEATPSESFTGFPPSGNTLCPHCDYDLSGLPIEYRCPECDFAYDRYTHSWRLSSSHLRQRVCFFILAIILVFSALARYGIGSNQRLTTWTVIIATISTLGLIATLYTVRPRLVLAITPDGIFQRRLAGRHRWTPWSKIAGAVVERGRKFDTLTILDRDRRTVLEVNLRDLFSHQQDAKDTLRRYGKVPVVSDGDVS